MADENNDSLPPSPPDPRALRAVGPPTVDASDLATMPQGWGLRDFNVSAYTPVEAYLDRLPRRKVMLDDLAKVNVQIGPRPAGDPPYWATLNVAIIYGVADGH